MPSPEPRPALISLSGPQSGAAFELVHERTTLGRDPGCTIRLVDGAASRRHAEVVREGGRFVLADLGSANGTRLNGRACREPTPLAADDVIEIGEVRLAFVDDLPADVVAAPTERAAGAPTAAKGEPTGAARLLGASPPMQEARRLIEKVARSSACALVTGETGTGKELAARAIHELSPRRAEPFAAANCAAIAEPLLLSDLFGHEKGAFTGAAARRAGQFEAAGRGTLFLDEVGELGLPAQAALLRVLDRGEYQRVGGTETLRTEARVVCATNRPLPRMVAEGKFREDLWHRIRVLEVRLPPLRERLEDLPLLVERFLADLGPVCGRPGARLAPAAFEKLRAHRFPGNVRELRNALERALVVADGPAIRADDLLLGDGASAPDGPTGASSAAAAAGGAGANLAETERRHIVSVLESTGWNVKRTAERLGIQRRTLYGKLRRFGLERP